MTIYDKPANDALVVRLADLASTDFDFINQGYGTVVLHVEESGGGVLAVLTEAGKERVWTVADGQEIPVLVRKILKETTVEVDGYSIGTATDTAKVRAYSWS